MSALLLGFIVWQAWRKRPGSVSAPGGYRLEDAALWSLMMVASICISHVGWNHYYCVLTLTYSLAGVAIAALPARSSARRTLAATFCIALACNWMHVLIPEVRQAGAFMFTSLALAIVLCAVRINPSTPRPGPEIERSRPPASAAG
jgi:hypothetical protein